MTKTFIFSIITLFTLTLTIAQPTPDMHISSYGDDKTPYPLYGGIFGVDIELNDSSIKLLGENFDAFYGAWDIDMTEANRVREIDPNFEFISYRGNWKVSGTDRDWIDLGNQNNILYYKLGTLKASINPKDNQLSIDSLFGSLVASTAHKDSACLYYVDKIIRFNTFIKVGNELVRITHVDSNKITVVRGFSSTTPENHNAGTVVLAPIYGRPPRTNSRKAYEYRHSDNSMLRWKYMLRASIQSYLYHGGGIWIDILIGNLSHYAMSGETIPPELIYNAETMKPYDKLSRAKDAEAGIKYIQETFYSIYDKYPLIWGNNMMYPVNTEHDRTLMLWQTELKPRPINGFAQENSVAQYGYGGHSGKKFFYASYKEWQETLQSNMYCGENKLANRPIIMDGGIDNKKFALLPKERRHELFVYGYATYLLGVKVEADDKIYSKFGLCPVVLNEDDSYHFELDPCFTWNIGRPVETHASQDYMKYKLKNRTVFLRKFENGIVLVNPSDKLEENISLKAFGKDFINPDAPNKAINKVNLDANNGMILLYKSAMKK